MLGAGSSLIGRTLKTEILREEALELALEGFLPFMRARRRAEGREAQPVPRTGAAVRLGPGDHAAPGRVSGAGGAGAGRHPVQRRLLHPGDSAASAWRTWWGTWYGRRPEMFENRDLDLAVARGRGLLLLRALDRAAACWCAAGCRGRTTSGWASRATANSRRCAWCRAAPRRARRSRSIATTLQLVANRPVSFRLYSSLTRTEDKLGDVVEFAADDPELHLHAPLNAVIRFGKKAEERLIPVKLGARLTEIGTLEIWCESKISDNRWRLQFELRKQAAAQPVERKAAAVMSEEALKRRWR